MKFEINAAITAQTFILPVFVESLPDLPKLRESLQSVTILPHMGARHAITWFYGHSGQPDLVLVGLGESAKFQSSYIREAAGNAGRALLKEKRRTAAVSFEALPSIGLFEGCTADDIAAWVEGSLLGTYSFDKYKAKSAEDTDLTLYFAGEENGEWTEAIRLGQVRAESTMWARDLTNEPPNYLRPRDLAARTVERFTGTSVQVSVHEADELERLGFAGLVAVGKGSMHPPVFLELRYCTDAAKPLVALIGKGITFDTGGISLKRDHDISDMRMDMAGAAAVLGALDIMVQSGAAVNVVVLVPSAENSPSDRSMLPGEIIRYANGLTVQVGNTDSEGRLILADALLYAHRIGAVQAIDMATLTYSVVGALGSKVAGILGDDQLVKAIKSAGEPYGENIWQLPLIDEYESYMDSDYADTSNISRVGEAGVITSSLFLRKFVHPTLTWAHIDMNGPKDSSSAKGEFAVGATGFGARMLAAFVTKQDAKK
ncbi:putative cytosol aminopeptidase [Paenibacillus baekrokdamisoli]|uniref:Probable cytosol aminopeptidase n=1 Tax=Paenibacillus baekrokdamisoli TaxID=1712516 RepID=A0A3G9IY24_9BACL|nr:leucyl aminopeptidase family protein [Paenibacillus baekrokdamisoli]MBB3068959.1 leucyl aminopeptidase [Paenibacillus baekrokdamisoli]BBH23780.1 putative cytosol aminopeptidase [Paenibacillus baekrokdamisoli]